MSITLPASLTGGAGSTPVGREWVGRLPGLVQRAVGRWGLRLGEPYEVGTAAWTAPGTRADGTPVVLKITFPHDEARHEALALHLWRGLAAVELLDHHAGDWALLLRRAHPGTPMLADTSPAPVRLRAGLELLANLHTARIDAALPDQVQVSAAWARLATERAARWSALYAGADQAVHQGLDLLHAFATPGAMPAPRVVMHGDLNPGNILLDAPPGGTGHWLAIDPKPMVGDPAYDLWPLIAQLDQPFGYPDPADELRTRVRAAEAVLGIPARRIGEWALARTVESILWQWDTWPDPQRQRQARAGLGPLQLWASLLAGAGLGR
ncbi:aminoglycoside phosphotransferase family protein [Ruania suaedae]|uniref:aminoglycoside phosphotransferase family protein n=1 Tax=Ruania suaedae TaxID=2897774 RepID=UPI001E546AF5|nr:aminoglycoside phosphotransferase family protein [Ruania suaedae]UFU04350.1 aminoglycoside phosphotransferase family protein [Ruania suaedae]